MINSMQKAIIKKDFRSVVFNKNLLIALIIIPLVFTVFIPAVFILSVHFAPDDMGDFEQLLGLLQEDLQEEITGQTIIAFIFNNAMPMFFMIIPIMASSIMAASSFVGEKEKRTLETLLYAPLTLTQIFQAKVWASFLLSMVMTFGSFVVMLLVVESLALLTLGSMIVPGISWLFTMLVVAPAASLLAIVFIVGGSAKAKTIEESQQRAVFLVLPLVLMIVVQFSGVILISAWYLLALGAIVAAIAFILMRKSMSKFTYELLLKR